LHPSVLTKSSGPTKNHGQNAGVLYTLTKTLQITTCYFFNNSNQNGGAILLSNYPNILNNESQILMLEDTIFDTNTAGDTGSAIYFDLNIEYIVGNASQCKFLENFSFYGNFISVLLSLK